MPTRSTVKKTPGEARSPFPKVTYERNADVYKVLAHPTRLEILNILKDRECCVEELIKVINISKANMSQHLALLRHNNLVKTRREGLNIYYQITDPRIVEPCAILKDLRGDR